MLREALTNIARHAHARSAQIDVITWSDRLTVDVRDDGIGIDPTTRRSGLTNMHRRAERHGGTMTVNRRDPSGTWLSWSIATGQHPQPARLPCSYCGSLR